MSWELYIKTLIESSPSIKRAAIVAVNDNSVCARTVGPNEFKATTSELKKLIEQFNNINDVPKNGIDLENVHYIVPSIDEGIIFGKKEKTGLFATKTKTVILIAVYEGEAASGPPCRSAVEKMASYLNGIGY